MALSTITAIRNRLICPKIIFWRAPLAITEGYSTIVITLSGITEGCSRNRNSSFQA